MSSVTQPAEDVNHSERLRPWAEYEADPEPEDPRAELEWKLGLARRHEPQLEELWRGKVSRHHNVDQRDSAFCRVLAGLGFDAPQIDFAYRISPRYRAKFDQRYHRNGRTFGAVILQRTIDRHRRARDAKLARACAAIEAGANQKRPMPVEVPPMTGLPNWRNILIGTRDRNRKIIQPKPLLANAITALRNAEEWVGVLAFDQFALTPVALKPAPWHAPGPTGARPWTDHDDRLTADWLQRERIFVSVEVAGQAVQTVAQARGFHPVRRYLESLKWDGELRVNNWLANYLGVQQGKYACAVGARWLISAVARIFKPGAKADCCLILEGPQGALKSSALRALADPWFTDDLAELGTKDAALQVRGVWIVEIAELNALTRAREISQVKAFMSRAVDRFRPPYGRRVIESPRQCVFAGTVNQSEYLRDETGARRFWPVKCGAVRLSDLKRDRDQLWAEAVDRFRKGEVWWLNSVELNRLSAMEARDRYEGDPWDDIIAAWVNDPKPAVSAAGPPFSSTSESVTVSDILAHCIGKRPETWTQADRTRVGRSLRALGWERYRERDGEDLPWRWRFKQ